MEHIANPTDESLQDAIEAALRTDLGADAPHIGVATDRGAVTLTGQLPSPAERQVALRTASEVRGVHAVADEMVVRDRCSPGETDTELAKFAQNAIESASDVPRDSVIAEVSERLVTLTGMVSSSEERVAAERAIINLPGLRRINNRVEIRA
jgi:osmotically-inducible protein OsmY